MVSYINSTNYVLYMQVTLKQNVLKTLKDEDTNTGMQWQNI
jgi:hypothetical protein